MTEEHSGRGDTAWSWIVKVLCLGAFGYAAFVKESPSFPIAFLSICGAVFPTAEFRGFLRSWRNRPGE